MNILENIKVLRLQKRLSQLDMAEALAISQGAYAQLENGKTEITLNRIEQLAKLFGMTTIELLQYGGETVQQPQIVDNEKVKELENRIKELESIIKDKEIIITLLLDKTNGDMENINAIFDAMIADKKRLGGDTKDVEQMEKLKTKFNLVNNKFISNIFNENNTR